MTEVNKKIQIVVYVTTEQAAKIKKLKEETGDSESSIVRMLINKSLANIKI